jgi:hypothetical protein
MCDRSISSDVQNCHFSCCHHIGSVRESRLAIHTNSATDVIEISVCQNHYINLGRR